MQSFDKECLQLAKHFLSATCGASDDDEGELAENIQALCEAACRDVEERWAAMVTASPDRTGAPPPVTAQEGSINTTAKQRSHR